MAAGNSAPQTALDWDSLTTQLQGKVTLLDVTHDLSSHLRLFNSASRSSPPAALGASPPEATSANASSGSKASPLPSPASEEHRPLAIAYPATTQDVSFIVRWASRNKLDISAKSGGYNPSNWSSSGQIVIDLADMREVVIELPGGRRVSSNAQAGHGSSAAHPKAPEQDTIPSGKHHSATAPSESASNNSVHGSLKGKRKLSPSAAGAGQSRPSETGKSESAAAAMKTNGHEEHPNRHPPSNAVGSPAACQTGGNAARSATGATGSTSGSSSRHMSIDTASTSPAPVTEAPEGFEDLSQSPAEQGKGKRRMLDSQQDDGPQRRRGSTSDTPRALSSDHFGGDVDSSTGDFARASQYMLANTYPPMSLAYASDDVKAHVLEELQRHDNVSNPKASAARSEASSMAADANTMADYHDVETSASKSESSSVQEGPGFLSHDALHNTTKLADPIPGANHGGAANPGMHGTPGYQPPPPDMPMAPGFIPFSPSTASGSNQFFSNHGSSLNISTSVSNGLSFGVQDPSHYVAVTLGAGARAQDLDSFTSQFGYIVPLACYPVGTAIFTTGGYGFISRLFGLSMDITLEIDLVLPSSGEIVHLVSDYESNPDFTEAEKAKQKELWWACRGAGTAFGILTGFKVKAFKIGNVLSGNIIFPFNKSTSASLLKHWRDCWKNAPRELYTNLTLTAGPSPSAHVVIVQFSWCGARQSDGENLLQAFLSWDGERCLLKDIEIRPYTHQQENVSQILTSKENTRWLVRSTLVNSLSDESIHRTIDAFRNAPAGTSWLFEIAGGAIGEPPGDTCFPITQRKAPIQTAALHQWIDPSLDESNKAAAENWIYDILSKEGCGPFPCFISSGEGRSRLIDVYGRENWEKLRSLKRKYDPAGMLRYTHFEQELLRDD